VNTRLVMIASAVVTGAAGIAASFLPQEILQLLGAPANDTLTLLVQLHGAALLGFAMLDWMAKDSTMGGIYNRPLVIGNLVHFLVGGLAAAKVAVRDGQAAVIAVAVVYGLLAIAFARIMMTSPRTSAART
jgi:hypothetical protein